MNYSTSEAMVGEIVAVVRRAGSYLTQARESVQSAIVEANKATAGATALVTEIDTQAAKGDAIWVRLKERKDEVRKDLLAAKATAQAILTAIDAQLGAQS